MLHDDAIPGDEQQRDAVIAGHRRVEQRFAALYAVDAHVIDGFAGVGVREHAVAVADLGVVSGKHSAAKSVSQALRHRERLTSARNNAQVGRHFVPEHVAHVPVRVVHDDL